MAEVRLENVDLEYPVYEVTGRSLKVTILKHWGEGRLNTGGGRVAVNALRNVSFALKSGDRLGLIGQNGSGKSTLLRVIAGVAHPTRGRIRISGRVVPLIDRGLGVNSELSGRDNIELPLLLLGARGEEIEAARKDILDFTGLGDFLQLPVRTYSDGMRARLAFALCTALPADVLVLDEWLSAGDAAFVAKAEERLRSYVARAGVVVLASHSLEMVRSVCNLVAWMQDGHLVRFGPPDEVIDSYLENAGVAPMRLPAAS
ncbi:MAG: ABC transporter ATP-binding protein [Hyphomonadaceae bacterium]